MHNARVIPGLRSLWFESENAMAAKCAYVEKVGAAYYVRKRIPRTWNGRAKGEVVRLSLRTKDRVTALKWGLEALAVFDCARAGSLRAQVSGCAWRQPDRSCASPIAEVIQPQAEPNLHGEDLKTVGTFSLAHGEYAQFVLTYSSSHPSYPDAVDPEQASWIRSSFGASA